MKELKLPLSLRDISGLTAGESVLLSGVVLTARDCAHRRICDMLNKGVELPFELKGALIYYAGPCPAKPGEASGSCGPTTSARMDAFAPLLLDRGVAGMIGKGEMSVEVREAIKRNTGVYFAAIGGAGALYGRAIKSCRCIAFEDLLSEAVYRLEIENFPVITAYDCKGGSIY